MAKNPNLTLSAADLAALLCSRVCHDVISPVGAINNGLSKEEISRLSSPIGLDLGARTPEETAISIAAEIIAGRWGGSGERLAGLEGPIHATADR